MRATASDNAGPYPDSEVHHDGANMGPIWGRQDPGGPHVGINLSIWDPMPHYTGDIVCQIHPFISNTSVLPP